MFDEQLVNRDEFVISELFYALFRLDLIDYEYYYDKCNPF
jgi:hypothetical protein